MGMQTAATQQPYSSAPQGKGQGLADPQAQMSPNQPPPTPIATQVDQQMPQGKGQGAMGAVTFPGQGGQPKLGQANPYPNTINPSDNTGMARPQTMGSGKSGGSAKGAQ